MTSLQKFFLEVARALEDLEYGETRSFRRPSRVNPYSRRSYYSDEGPPSLLIFVENSERKELIEEFLKNSFRIGASVADCYWALLFGTPKGISFLSLPRLNKALEELGEIGEKDWKKALSWLKYYAGMLEEPVAILSLIFEPPPKELWPSWRSLWSEVDFLAILGPSGLGDFAKFSDIFLLVRALLRSLLFFH